MWSEIRAEGEATALFIRLRQPSAQVPSVQEPADVAEKGDVSVEEVFSIPDSIK